jgi:tetratricopeptide (TPR) repeat protein
MSQLLQLKHTMAFLHKNVFVSLIFLIIFNLAGQAQETNDEYRKTIESADNYFTKGDYINAKASYQIAVRLAPEEQYPKDRLQQSLDMIKVQMYQSNLYTQKIMIADELYKKNELNAALQAYQEALTILPGDVYASGKIQEINRDQVDLQQLEENYQKSIVDGDKFFKEGKLEKALAEYRNASLLKPSEAYPREKAIQAENMIAEGKNITDEYEAALQDAELAISRNKYDEAISLLEKAINLMPDEPLPMQKLAEAQNLKAAWDSYSSIINAADEYYISKEFQLAKDKYLQAQSIKPADDYPKRMLEKIDIALMDLSKANRSSYEVSIALADKLYNEQDYERAMVEYQNALHFKPNEEYAKQLISDINKALSLRKSQEDAYLQAISRADDFYKQERYEEAREEYLRATGIKSLEQYPKVKVDEINSKLSNLATQRSVYNNLIKGADRLFFSDEYVEARNQYRKASELFPKEQYPLDQITMINEILGLRDKYVKAVTRADQLLYEKDYEAAMLEFKNAANISPKEIYPLEKIKEIQRILAANASKQIEPVEKEPEIALTEEDLVTEEDYQQGLEAYDENRVFTLDFEDAEPTAEEIAENNYLQALTTADSTFAEKDYRNALAYYQAARAIKPGEVYAERKITEINAILSDIAAKEALENQYNDVIVSADKALLAKDYDKALTDYQAALKIKPGETYAQGKITEINNALGEIAAKDALENQYKDVIASADKALLAKDYNKALVDYQAALSLKPGEAYAQGKIDEINNALGEIAAKEALENQYKDVIASADKAFLAKDYNKALVDYQAALKIKPGETYAQGKITEINNALGEIAAKEALENQYKDVIASADKALLAKDYNKALTDYQAALSLKPGEAYAQGKINEINNTLGEIAAKEALENQYKDVIASADKALMAKDYDKALADYQAALSLKPGEAYAQGKINEINNALGEIAAKEALENQYKDVIASADKALLAKDYNKALADYQAALKIKPGEAYAQGKILEVETVFAEQAKQLEINNQYVKVIAIADEYFKKEQFEEARASYQQAQAIKPAEEFPGKQILLIDRRLESQAAERDQAYQSAISKADIYLGQQDYEMAKLQYTRALDLKPGEIYPTDKLKIVNEEINKKRQLTQAEYDKSISEADKFFTAKTYDNAIDSYRAASILKPEEEYPKEMISRILKILSERSIVQLNSNPLLVTSNTLHKFDFSPVAAKDRKSNYLFFRARNVSETEYKLIISYGQGQARNGGVVVRVPPGGNVHEYVVRISAQYKWFSDDNNWISFYPEGGNLEVSLLQISYSD